MKQPKKLDPLREHIINLLTKGEAHMDVRSALDKFPRELRGQKPQGAPHTPWQLLEHMRIAQWDILNFSLNAKHRSPKWPEEYWPKRDAPRDDAAWKTSVKAFHLDLKRVCEMVGQIDDLYARIPHGDGQTYLREALLVADHNAYHLGQLVMVRKILEGE